MIRLIQDKRAYRDSKPSGFTYIVACDTEQEREQLEQALQVLVDTVAKPAEPSLEEKWYG